MNKVIERKNFSKGCVYLSFSNGDEAQVFKEPDGWWTAEYSDGGGWPLQTQYKYRLRFFAIRWAKKFGAQFPAVWD